MDRRTFLKGTLLSSAFAWYGCGLETPPRSPERIIIVGAGMAGIAAARHLHDNGHQVSILEGRNRLGGRIWTSSVWPEFPVDLGASWIHEPRGNPLTLLANEIDAERVATDSDLAPLYDFKGRKLADRIWDKIANNENQIAKAIRKAQRQSPDISEEQAIRNDINVEEFSEADRRIFDFTVSDSIEQDFASDVRELSAHHINEGDSFSGEDVVLPQGYAALPTHLARGLEIKLNQRVTEIRHHNPTVTVTTETGQFEADRVIVTLPIGVLKQGDVKFDPALPPAKQKAIESLGTGVMNKLTLRFATPFWERQADWIGRISQEKGRFSTWLSSSRTSGYPILTVFHVGNQGERCETMATETLVTQAMRELRQMYGPQIPEPVGAQATRWKSDPFARCSYSSPTLGMTSNTRSDLAAPINDRIFFAGEATSSAFPASVHGAYLSGQREAKRILNLPPSQ